MRSDGLGAVANRVAPRRLRATLRRPVWGKPMTDSTQPDRVPLNLWLCPGDDGSASRHHLAVRAVETFSPRDGIVVDLVGRRGEVLAAAATTGRHALVLPAASPCQGRPRVSVLTHLRGTADLALALPAAISLRPPTRPTMSSRAAAVIAAQAATVLRPGGYLVVVTAPAGPGSDPVSTAVAAVSACGFAYFQHVVAVVEPATPHDIAAGDGRVVAHLDVLAFCRRAA